MLVNKKTHGHEIINQTSVLVWRVDLGVDMPQFVYQMQSPVFTAALKMGKNSPSFA